MLTPDVSFAVTTRFSISCRVSCGILHLTVKLEDGCGCSCRWRKVSISTAIHRTIHHEEDFLSSSVFDSYLRTLSQRQVPTPLFDRRAHDSKSRLARSKPLFRHRLGAPTATRDREPTETRLQFPKIRLEAQT
jgi:hypothetical protein